MASALINRAVERMLACRSASILPADTPPCAVDLVMEGGLAWKDAENHRVTIITDRQRISAKQIRGVLSGPLLGDGDCRELEIVTLHPIGWQAQNPFLSRRSAGESTLRIIGWTQVLFQPLTVSG